MCTGHPAPVLFLITTRELSIIPVLSYILWYSREIYDVESVKGTITTKLKGVSRTNGSGSFENAGNITWDEAEYVIPPRVSRLLLVLITKVVHCGTFSAGAQVILRHDQHVDHPPPV